MHDIEWLANTKKNVLETEDRKKKYAEERKVKKEAWQKIKDERDKKAAEAKVRYEAKQKEYREK